MTAPREPCLDLGGAWSAAPADDALRRVWADPAFEPVGWDQVTVPGHWRSHAVFAEHDGPLLHRRQFETSLPRPEHERRWLEFDGVFSQGDVWLDGTYLGNTEGAFLGHRFEVTEHLRAASEHTLAVEVTSSPVRDPSAKRALTGPWMHGSTLDPMWNPGGIWRPLRIRTTGPIACTRLRVLCTEANERRAVLSLDAGLDAAQAQAAALVTTVGNASHRLEQPLAAGPNRVRWTMTVDNPRRWWPRALGEPFLYDLVVAVADAAGEPSDERRLRIGLRTVSMRDWVLSVNGERLFVKGASALPTRYDLANASATEIADDVTRATELGLDLLRVHAHIARPELYAAADETGLLLWQDLPLQGGYDRSVRRQAITLARGTVDLLGHHPSIALWCGHDEPFAHPVDPAPRSRPGFTVARLVAAQELPTWNRSVLDRSIRRALTGADPSRPVTANSGVLPHPPQLDGSASHFAFGWHHGDTSDLALAARTIPRVVRFVARLGAPAVPDTADFCRPADWPTLDWERLEARHGYDVATFDRRVPPSASTTFAAWRASSQHLQAELVRRQVELLRRLKYRPTGGVIVHALADAHPSIGWGVYDAARHPKLAAAALAAACRPVIVVADLPPHRAEPGTTLALDVHVVSDLRAPLTAARVTATFSGCGPTSTWVFEGDVDADAVVRVGHLRLALPDESGVGTLQLALSYVVDGQTRESGNRYEIVVGPL